MIVKVCGMREADNIRTVEQTGADWMGFIFFPRSARYVETVPSYLPVSCRRIGVFVNESTEVILRKAADFGLHGVQLHGKETPEQCRQLAAAGLEVVKVFSIATERDLHNTCSYEDTCHYFLFDTACPQYGGSGKTFAWDILALYKGNTPFILSGGIGPEQLDDLRRFRHPQWAGIDLNSRFETAPARKDASLLHTFIQQIRQEIQ